MSHLEKYPAINEEDISAVEAFLLRNKAGEIRNFETLDGFLTALIIGPDFVAPSQFMPVIASGFDNDGGIIFNNEEEFKNFYDVLMRHWNHINKNIMMVTFTCFILLRTIKGKLKVTIGRQVF
jgi:yecA family protein